MDAQGGLAIDTQVFTTLVLAVDAPVLANVTEVEVGSRVNSIFLNVQATHETLTALANIYMIIYKNPGGNIGVASIPDGNVTGSNDFKRQIFHTEMAMGPGDVGVRTPITLFKGVLKIPKHMASMRINDAIQIELFSPGTTWNFCVQCIYKEFR